MISARFDRDGEKLTLSVLGHAHYSEGQADIVCAAVSSLVLSLAGYLTHCTELYTVRGIGHGYALIECSDAGEEAMKMTCLGLMQIQDMYPQCIQVINQALSLVGGSPS
jgi:uncharacterized protein YsxB (DUF464 family)